VPLGSESHLHPALLTILQLDVDGRGELEPELVADICDGDRDLILRLLHETGKEEIAWRQSAETALLAGDEEEAAVCEHEMRTWEGTTQLLRRALRFVVGGHRRG
jgi:hypothetical protein